MDKFYTAAQVARLLRISVVTVRWRARKHNIGQKFGKAHMFTADDVERMQTCPAPGRPKRGASVPGASA